MNRSLSLRTAALALATLSIFSFSFLSSKQTVTTYGVHAVGANQVGYAPYAFPGAASQMRYAPAAANQASGGDYLEQVTTAGTIKWNAKQMPIKVFIDDGTGTPGYRPNFPDLIVNAFDEWCNKVLPGRASWKQVSSPKQADIVVQWTNNTKIKNGGAEAGETATIVNTNRVTGENKIEGADISILTSLFGKPFSDYDMNKICLHEVGHSLGLQGHSTNQSDIMFPSVNPSQHADLSARDVNTMQRLYGSDSSTIAQVPAQNFNDGQPQESFRSAYRNKRAAGFNRFPRATRMDIGLSPDGAEAYGPQPAVCPDPFLAMQQRVAQLMQQRMMQHQPFGVYRN